jgi:hypothetical protein
LRAEREDQVVAGMLLLRRICFGGVPDGRIEPVERADDCRRGAAEAVVARDVGKLVQQHDPPALLGPAPRVGGKQNARPQAAPRHRHGRPVGEAEIDRASDAEAGAYLGDQSGPGGIANRPRASTGARAASGRAQAGRSASRDGSIEEREEITETDRCGRYREIAGVAGRPRRRRSLNRAGRDRTSIATGAEETALPGRIGRGKAGISIDTTGKRMSAAMTHCQMACLIAAEPPAGPRRPRQPQQATSRPDLSSTSARPDAEITAALLGEGIVEQARQPLIFLARQGEDSSRAATAMLTDPSKKVRTTCESAEPRTSSAGAVGR